MLLLSSAAKELNALPLFSAFYALYIYRMGLGRRRRPISVVKCTVETTTTPAESNSGVDAFNFCVGIERGRYCPVIVRLKQDSALLLFSVRAGVWQ
jgi:hypothetical protein